MKVSAKDLTIAPGGAINSQRQAILDARGTVVLNNAGGAPSVSSIGGTLIENAQAVVVSGGAMGSPTILNYGNQNGVNDATGKGVIISVAGQQANGQPQPGGGIDLASYSIVSASSVSFGGGGGSVGNITITGSGASQLYGVNADTVAGIATGYILVNKTANGSLVDVGSANKGGAAASRTGIFTQSPAFTIAGQLGTTSRGASIVPVIAANNALSGGGLSGVPADQTGNVGPTTPPATGPDGMRPTITAGAFAGQTLLPAADNQAGTAILTGTATIADAVRGGRALPTATINNIASGNPYTQSTATPTLPSFVAVSPSTGTGGSAAVPAYTPPGALAPSLSAIPVKTSGSAGVVYDPSKVTVNK